MDDKAFNEFLEHADQVVRSWPLWKQTLLGGTGKREEPREPVDNFKQVADCLRSENRQLKQTNENLRTELVGLYSARTEQMAELEKLQHQVHTLQQQVANKDCAGTEALLRYGNETLKQENDALKTLLQGRDALDQSNHELRRELEQAEDEHARLRANLQYMQEDYRKLHTEYSQKVVESNEFFKKIHRLNERLEAVARIAESGWQE